MNHTTNYQLSQWAKSDQVKMEDFNADNAKIDAAIAAADAKADALAGSKADASALAALTQTVAGKGNCEIVTGSYVGTGEYGQAHPCTITFPRKPMIVFLNTSQAEIFSQAPRYSILFRGAAYACLSSYSYLNHVTWGERSVSWYYDGPYSEPTRYQVNMAGQTYEYIAFVI